MLQLLNRTSAGTTSNYIQHRASVCSRRTDEFYTNMAQYLLKRMSDTEARAAFGALDSIMQSAGELSGRLWSRKTDLRLRRLHHFSGSFFMAGSPEMEAHPINLLDDDEDESCDGWGVSLCAHPLVVGTGNSDGSNYTA